MRQASRWGGLGRPVAATGVTIVVLYTVVCAATLATTSRSVRPLFEGFSPPAPYRWVNPPRQFAAGNVKPRASITDIGFEASGSGAAALFTDDAQVAVNLAAGALAPHPGETKVTATITPLDPATLGALPPGLAADGNAYRIELAYAPSGQGVSSLVTAGNVFLTGPNPPKAMLFSTDGRAWQQLASQPAGDPSVIGASLSQPGFFIAASHASPPGAPAPATPGGSHPSVVLAIAGVVVLVALTLVLVPLVWRHRHR